MSEYRSQFKIVDRVIVNTLPTMQHIKKNYEVHMFDDGYIGLWNGKRYLKPQIAKGKDNYIHFKIMTVEGKQFKAYMHRLVALAYLDGYKDGYFVDHKDNDKSNCHINNLEWVTHKENTQRAVKDDMGVGRPKVEKKPKVYKTKLERSQVNSKITYDDVRKIFEMLDEGYTLAEIAKEIGVSQPAISQIVNGKRWKDHPASIEYRSKVS